MKHFLWKLRVVAAMASTVVAYGQHAHHHAKAPATVNVVMLSDLHFDPYRDAAKFPQLRAAAVSEWAHILDEPASATQAEDFAAVQKACDTHSVDTSWTLLSASLQAAHLQQPKPLFVAVSGDLVTHQFDCRLRTLLKGATDKDVSEFAAKTIAFVALRLHETFPGVAVYFALGNNDSGCTDYEDSRNSDFLRSAAQSFAANLPKNSRETLLRTFGDEGDFSVAMPAPMERTRMIVLQDLFQSRAYKPCGSNGDGGKAAAAQIAWLRAELAEARKHHEHAWVMAHIPPGVDVYAAFHKLILTPQRLCSVRSPTKFLSSDDVSDAIAEFPDVVRLALFGHTHMDEMKLLRNAAGGGVPVKLVPSISPVNGNSPAFMVAQVDAHSATMRDYGVYLAQMPTAKTWNEAYRYSRTYNLPDFSANSLQQLTGKMVSDKTGESEVSRTYAKWVYPGDTGIYAVGLHQIWPAYACSMVENGGPAYHACMCPAQPAAQ